MNNFKIKKTSKKLDLIKFLSDECGYGVNIDDKDNIIDVNGTSIHIIFGKTYIRIQDAEIEPSKITQLFYNINLDSDKYKKKISEVVKMSVSKTELLIRNNTMADSYKSLLTKFIGANKYHYEPYDIGTSDMAIDTMSMVYPDNMEIIGTVVSDKNFTIDITMGTDGKLIFHPIVYRDIISNLSTLAVTNAKDYISITQGVMDKIDKLKKVMAIIINDITTLVNVNM
jgi:hypothetical protein